MRDYFPYCDYFRTSIRISKEYTYRVCIVYRSLFPHHSTFIRMLLYRTEGDTTERMYTRTVCSTHTYKRISHESKIPL